MATRKRRTQRNTILVYGEGSDDMAWIKYIKSLFAREKSGIKIDEGGGGSPVEVLEKMMKRREFLEYDKRYALVDSDRPEIDKARQFAKENRIDLMISRGCLEFELLSICGASKKVLNRAKIKSENAKVEFKKKCKHTEKDYSKAFPKNKLMAERLKGNEWLDRLISIFE